MRTTARIDRRVTAIAGLVVALTLAWPSAASARPQASVGPCPVPRPPGETVQNYARHLILCATALWEVPGGAERAICIARRESGLIPSAASPGGRYLGLFQHSARMWPARLKAWAKPAWRLGTSALNGRSNAIVTIRMVHAAHGWVAAGWPLGDC